MMLHKKTAQLLYNRCLGCRPCAAMGQCPNGSLREEEGRLYVHNTCNGCGTCTRACPARALEIN
ncbi:MAG: 4Fe-4S dicluster domain-containing protein [Bacillota bacterium]